jgi:hypothetical protein
LKGLAILDVSMPSQPTALGSKAIAAGVSAQDVAVVGTRAFPGTSVYLYVMDVTNPSAPSTLAGRLLTGGATRVAVIVSDSANAQDVLELWDVTTSTAPVRLSTTPLGNIGSVQGLALTATAVYVSVGTEGLKVLNASGSAEGSVTDTFRGEYLAVASGNAVVAGQDTATTLATLRVVDVGLPSQPTVVGTLEATVPQNLGGPVFKGVDLDAGGSVAVVTLGLAGLWTVDLSNPTMPQQVGSWASTGFAAGVTVTGTRGAGPVRAYVANGAKGLAIVDVSTPSQPTTLGSKTIAAGVAAQDVAVVGTRAFLGTSLYLYIMDVATPSAPSIFAGRLLTGTATHIAATATRVAVLVSDSAHGQDVMELWNVTTSTAPVRLSITPVGSLGSARGIVLTASRAYIGNLSAGVIIFDVSSSTVALIGTAMTVGDAYEVRLDGGYLYAADVPATVDVFALPAP